LVNSSGKYISLDEHGAAFLHDAPGHPDARSIVATPGGHVPRDVVQKHGLADHVKPDDAEGIAFDETGNAVYHDDSGRARSVETLPKTDPRRLKGMRAEKERRDRADEDAARAPEKPQLRPMPGPEKPAAPAPAKPAAPPSPPK
jgi:hypothetical protein